eukprot:s4096_g9.t1
MGRLPMAAGGRNCFGVPPAAFQKAWMHLLLCAVHLQGWAIAGGPLFTRLHLEVVWGVALLHLWRAKDLEFAAGPAECWEEILAALAGATMSSSRTLQRTSTLPQQFQTIQATQSSEDLQWCLLQSANRLIMPWLVEHLQGGSSGYATTDDAPAPCTLTRGRSCNKFVLQFCVLSHSRRSGAADAFFSNRLPPTPSPKTLDTDPGQRHSVASNAPEVIDLVSRDSTIPFCVNGTQFVTLRTE